MDDKSRKRTSKFLSLILRHQPELAGLELEPGGWVPVDDLLAGCTKAGRTVSRDELLEVVAKCDKQRFALSDDGQKIRANQGHSTTVDLELAATPPPAVLYHGTATRFLESIAKEGLVRRARHHVHLSSDVTTAHAVGSRHGKPVILTVDSAAMAAAGHDFFLSENGVWLVDSVPAEYLSWPSD